MTDKIPQLKRADGWCEPKLEKFKFETTSNVSIKIEELENKVEVRIEPLDTTKEIEIYYKPKDSFEMGEFYLRDNHRKVEIDRGHPVASYDDGDVDWDVERVFPCDRCSSQWKHIEELTKKIDLKDMAFDMMSKGFLMILDSFKKK